jgi:hypothetical protein
MEIQKPNWKKIELCSFFIALLEDRLVDIEEAEHDENYNKRITDLKYFYMMVFNVAFYEFALAYAEVQDESNKIIEKYLKKKYGEEGLFGGENGEKL